MGKREIKNSLPEPNRKRVIDLLSDAQKQLNQDRVLMANVKHGVLYFLEKARNAAQKKESINAYLDEIEAQINHL